MTDTMPHLCVLTLEQIGWNYMVLLYMKFVLSVVFKITGTITLKYNDMEGAGEIL